MRTIPSSLLLPSQWPQPHNEELLLAMEESNLEDKKFVEADVYLGGFHMFAGDGFVNACIINFCQLNEIRDTNRNLVVIGKTTADNDKEDDNDADDDDADNAEESEGEEFEQETG
ncbi:hypothetical protein Golax_006239 [Gossypium laxum]|uniref:Uncharacterized protein n=1 Tax=Gossypium laxum TaxID=34288 RepID=A0A7J9A3Q5_9ROSI|nr:hypothetical protein [Gossypium laxum]